MFQYPPKVYAPPFSDLDPFVQPSIYPVWAKIFIRRQIFPLGNGVKTQGRFRRKENDLMKVIGITNKQTNKLTQK